MTFEPEVTQSLLPLSPVAHFRSSSGVDIYRLPLVLFPNDFRGYAFVLEGAGPLTLVDTGSGMGRSNADLLDGFRQIRERFGRRIALEDIERILITHGHIDHFGGLAFVRARTQAPVGIHELDRRVLSNYEERLVVATKALGLFIERAGVPPTQRDSLFAMYGFAKKQLSSMPVDFSLEDEQDLDGMQFIHTPGHCPGQVCIRLGDLLLSADHVLSQTTPHQSPESITHHMGLDHYDEALRKMLRVQGIRLTIGSHEGVIHDLHRRIHDIRASHRRKLERIRHILRSQDSPMTIHDICNSMYPDVEGYHILLALEEAGAHVEYLYQHGELSIANLQQVEDEPNPAVRYHLIAS